MKRAVFVLALLTLLLPIAARADGVDLTNSYGTVTILASGITSVGSQLRSYNGVSAPHGGALGTVSFATGSLTSGNIWSGGTFSSVGSSFDIIGIGAWLKKLPGESKEKGKVTLFSGTFIGPIDWTLVATNKTFFHEYQLTGEIEGLLYTGRVVTGSTTETIYTFWNQERVDNRGSIHFGATHLNTTPEPGTLGMLGIGLVGIAGAVHRRFGM